MSDLYSYYDPKSEARPSLKAGLVGFIIACSAVTTYDLWSAHQRQKMIAACEQAAQKVVNHDDYAASNRPPFIVAGKLNCHITREP
jgi:hypothetical protein